MAQCLKCKLLFLVFEMKSFVLFISVKQKQNNNIHKYCDSQTPGNITFLSETITMNLNLITRIAVKT